VQEVHIQQVYVAGSVRSICSYLVVEHKMVVRVTSSGGTGRQLPEKAHRRTLQRRSLQTVNSVQSIVFQTHMIPSLGSHQPGDSYAVALTPTPALHRLHTFSQMSNAYFLHLGADWCISLAWLLTCWTWALHHPHDLAILQYGYIKFFITLYIYIVFVFGPSFTQQWDTFADFFRHI